MTRYVAFLRGVSPMNCRMPELKRCFEAAGFTEVKTLLSSGNVAFTARHAVVPTLEKRIEKAMREHLPQVFSTIVRPSSFLQSLIDTEPHAAFRLPKDAKRIVTFLPTPYDCPALQLPIEKDDAVILQVAHSEVLCAYVPNDKGPVFMALLERTFGKKITTRTLDTVRKCAAA